jgi:hypothetical protein
MFFITLVLMDEDMEIIPQGHRDQRRWLVPTAEVDSRDWSSERLARDYSEGALLGRSVVYVDVKRELLMDNSNIVLDSKTDSFKASRTTRQDFLDRI